MKKIIFTIFFIFGATLTLFGSPEYIDFPIIKDQAEYLILRNVHQFLLPVGCRSEVFLRDGDQLMLNYPIIKATVIESSMDTVKIYVIFRGNVSDDVQAEKPFFIEKPEYFVARVRYENSGKQMQSRDFSTNAVPPGKLKERVKSIRKKPDYSFFVKRDAKILAVWIRNEGKSKIPSASVNSFFMDLFRGLGYSDFSLLNADNRYLEIIKIVVNCQDRGKIQGYQFNSAAMISNVIRIRNDQNQIVTDNRNCVSNGAGATFELAALNALKRSKDCLRIILN